MEEKSDCTTNGSNTTTNTDVNGGPQWMPGWTESNWGSTGNTLTIDTESEPGSWKEALKYSQHIIIKD